VSGRARIVVVGGGVAGLAAARALAARFEVVVLETQDRVGGKLVTAEFRGRPLDVGPDNFITRNDAAVRLCREIGLADELLAPATSRAAVYARGRPRPLPAGLVLGVPTDLRALRRSGVVGTAATLRAALDLVLPRSRATVALGGSLGGGDVGEANGDPTVHEVLVPRIGRAAVAALVDPLLGGINAGDCSRLSFRASAPQLASAAAGARSVVRALRARAPATPGPAGAAAPLFLGLSGGIESLATGLRRACEQAGVTVRTSCEVTGVELAPTGTGPSWTVRFGGGQVLADGLVLAVPATSAGRLLADAAPEIALECASISYSGVATVTLAWPEASVPSALARLLDPAPAAPGDHPALPGSGVLVPRATGGIVTAATFTSTKWPRSARPGEVVVRVSAGRDGDGRALELDDGELVDAVRAELATLLGITEAPLDRLVWRWPASFPQYASGHLARSARIAALAGALPGLALAGAAYDGIGIPACIAGGERAGASVGGRIGR